MDRLNKRKRKEKKIFDPSDTAGKKCRKKSVVSNNSTYYDLSSIPLRELSIKLERLRPEKIEREMNLMATESDGLEIDELLDKESQEDVVSVEELLSDKEADQEADLEAPGSTSTVKFECPFCPRERTSLNRLRLHICSEHEHHSQSILCPVCSESMMGWAFEVHVLRQHETLLEGEHYLFGLECSKPSKEDSEEAHDDNTSAAESYKINFNVENPWQEILSPTCRQKRSMDAMTVGSIMQKHQIEPYSYQGETTTTSKVFWKNKKHFFSLQNKVNFTCSLTLNSHYKEYLRRLKQLKMKKILLLKFASRLNDTQVEKIKNEIECNEELLKKFSDYDFSPSREEDNKSSLMEQNFETQKMLLNKEEKRKMGEAQILRNLTKKGIIKDKSCKSIVPNRRVLAVNKRTGEVSRILSCNIGSLLHIQDARCRPRSEPETDPLSIEGEEAESKEIVCRSLDPDQETMIAIRIPIEDILENNHVMNIKSET